MPLKQKTRQFAAVDLTPQEGGEGLTRGILRQVSVIGFDTGGALVDDLAFTLTDPTGNQIVWTPTPARNIADPRLFVPFNLEWPIEDTSNFTLRVQRLVVNTPISVFVTFIWEVKSMVQT